MLTKFMARPYSLSFTFLSPPRFFPKPLSPSLHAATIAGALDQAFSYGPSLHKGYKFSLLQPPHKQQQQQHDEEVEDDYFIDTESFTRVFEITALQVPSERCFALESRLRGHLLNWPRVRNIARVPGDEMEDKFKKLLAYSSSDDEKESLVSLNRRIYGKAEGDGELLSPVLYRDKLARTFNSRGFVNFRNLAKLSRPKRRREEREKRRERGTGKSEFAVVEVVEEEGEEEGEDLSGLLGDEFRGRKWKGSTRLLLLDERYAGKGLDQLPEAIKVSVPTL